MKMERQQLIYFLVLALLTRHAYTLFSSTPKAPQISKELEVCLNNFIKFTLKTFYPKISNSTKKDSLHKIAIPASHTELFTMLDKSKEQKECSKNIPKNQLEELTGFRPLELKHCYHHAISLMEIFLVEKQEKEDLEGDKVFDLDDKEHVQRKEDMFQKYDLYALEEVVRAVISNCKNL